MEARLKGEAMKTSEISTWIKGLAVIVGAVLRSLRDGDLEKSSDLGAQAIESLGKAREAMKVNMAVRHHAYDLNGYHQFAKADRQLTKMMRKLELKFEHVGRKAKENDGR
jgi:hypothetical protein